MPSVLIMPNGTAIPDLVSVQRNDQTIMWQLAPGVRWGAAIPPIRFLPGGGNGPGGIPYSDWPGSDPLPIDTGAAAGGRPWWVNTNKPMPGTTIEFYHYEFDIEVSDESGVWTAKTVKQIYDPIRGWHDPDMENRPQP